MAREQCVDDLRYHRIVVADDPRENRRVTVLPQASDKIIAQLVFYPSRAQPLFGEVAAAQITQRARNTHERNPHSRKLSTIIRRNAECVFSGPMLGQCACPLLPAFWRARAPRRSF